MHDNTDAEQIAALKAWWQDNGRLVIISVAVLLVSNFGWQSWQRYQANRTSSASEAYQQVLQGLSDNAKPATLNTLASKVRDGYPKTPYASLASLQIAKLAVHRQDYPAASQALQWVIDHHHSPSLAQIARLRLARLQLAQNQGKAALATLDDIQAKSFSPLIAEVHGDIYAALKQPEKARQAYAKALRALSDTETKTVNPALQALRLKAAQL